MSGVSARLQTTVDGTPSNNGAGTAANATPTSNRSSSASLDFTQGPIKAAAVYERRTTYFVAAAATSGTALNAIGPTGTTNAVIPEINYYSVGASYDFKVVKPAILYYNQSTNGSATTTGKTSGTLLGVTVPVSSTFSVFANYVAGKVENNGAGIYDTTGMQLVANYSLSKRTGIYAAYGQTEWQTDNTATASSVQVQQYGLGMRHTF
jgi:predicted porin